MGVKQSTWGRGGNSQGTHKAHGGEPVSGGMQKGFGRIGRPLSRAGNSWTVLGFLENDLSQSHESLGLTHFLQMRELSNLAVVSQLRNRAR